jgi:hypothetical protein
LQLVATGFCRFFEILQTLRPATQLSPKRSNRNRWVQLHPVAFGPVSVIFSVASTGP